MTDHLRDSTPDLEKYKAVLRKIEIKRTANFSIILFLKLKLL